MVLRLAMDINKVDINKVVMSGETSLAILLIILLKFSVLCLHK